MMNVIQLRDIRRTRADHKILCRSGFHQWQVETHGHFDVKQGKLLTLERCHRCGVTRTRRT